MNKIILCLYFLFFVFYACNNNNTHSDIFYITTNELLTPKNKGLLRLNEAMYKNRIFQISGNIIFKEQVKDNIPFRNKSCIYFGNLTSNNNLARGRIIICNFDTLIYDFFNIGDDAIIQGRFKEIRDDGDIIFEKCQIVKLILSLELP